MPRTTGAAPSGCKVRRRRSFHCRIRRLFGFSSAVSQAIITVAHNGYTVAYLNGNEVGQEEWRCRQQVDVSWCSTTRELDSSVFRLGANKNLLAFVHSATSDGTASWWKVRLTVWLSDGSRQEIITDNSTAPLWRAGVPSYRAQGFQGMTGLSTTWDQGYEASQLGWNSEVAFNESRASAYNPLRSWKACAPVIGSGGRCAISVPESHNAILSCGNSTITSVVFASFGTPVGSCGGFEVGQCDDVNSTAVVTKLCVGQTNCTIFVSTGTFGGDPCLNTPKQLSAEVTCSGPPPQPLPFDFPVRSNSVPTRVISTWKPTTVFRAQQDIFTYNLTQNIAGWCAVSLPPLASSPQLNGTTLLFQFGERIYNNNGSTWQMYYWPFVFWQNFSIVLDGTIQPVIFNLTLTQFVFQYITVSWPESIMGGPPPLNLLECYQVASDVPRRGHFTSSNSLVNAISVMHYHTIINSNQDQPLSDPERDNINWLGDAHLAADSAMAFLDGGAFYERTLAVIKDVEAHCERLGPYPNGLYTIPYIVPTTNTGFINQPCDNWFGGAVSGYEWDVGYMWFADLIYRHYNDTRVLSRYYDGMVRLQNSLMQYSPNGLYTAAIFGDWANQALGITTDVCVCGYFTNQWHYINSTQPCTCQGTTAPNQIAGGWNVGFYWIYAADALYRFANALGKDSDAQKWFQLAEQARATYAASFVTQNPTSGQWFIHGGGECEECMGAQAMALQLATVAGGAVMDDKVTQSVCQQLINQLAIKKNHLDTGVLSTKFLLPALAQSCGEWDLAFTVLTQTTVPSWGFTLSLGMTTITEQWWETGTPEITGGALNHPMFATAAAWFFSGLAGLDLVGAMQSTADSPFSVTPVMPAQLAEAAASIDTARGHLACSWRQTIDAANRLPLHVNVTLPVGTSAVLTLPFPGGYSTNVVVSEAATGRAVWQRDGFVQGASPGVTYVERKDPSWPNRWFALDILLAAGSYEFTVVSLSETMAIG